MRKIQLTSFFKCKNRFFLDSGIGIICWPVQAINIYAINMLHYRGHHVNTYELQTDIILRIAARFII